MQPMQVWQDTRNETWWFILAKDLAFLKSEGYVGLCNLVNPLMFIAHDKNKVSLQNSV